MTMSKIIERLSETNPTLLEEFLEIAFNGLNDIDAQERIAREMDISVDRVSGVAGVMMGLKDLDNDNVETNWMPVRTEQEFQIFIEKVRSSEY